MGKMILTATTVRNDFFRLLDEVAKSRRPVYIKKDDKVRVKLDTVGSELEESWVETKNILKRLYGMWGKRSNNEIRGRFREANLATTKKIRART